jgi:transcriptional regulator with XRE-family HTH domain
MGRMSKTLQGNLRILAHNTRELRREIGETQEAVAEKAGISCRAYQSIEAGRGNPSLKTLDQLAFFYQVTLSRLFYLSRLRTDDLINLNKNLWDTFKVHAF